MLLQQKVDEVYSKISSSRKLQVGSRARAEKVRTYNFPNDRITDHRLKLTLNHLDDFMGGGPKLEYMIDELQKLNSLERIQEEINASNWVFVRIIVVIKIVLLFSLLSFNLSQFLTVTIYTKSKFIMETFLFFFRVFCYKKWLFIGQRAKPLESSGQAHHSPCFIPLYIIKVSTIYVS